MIKFVLVLIILCCGLLLGPHLMDLKGMAIINVGDLVIETTVAYLLFLLFVGLILFLLTEWLVKKLIGMVTGSSQWLGSWGERKKQRAFTQGLMALAEGNYQAAQGELGKIENSDFAGLNLLAAAEAERHLGNHDKAIALWDKAATQKPSMMAAKLKLIGHCIDQQNFTAAQAHIDGLDDKQKLHGQVVLASAQILASQGEWNQLKEKLPKWKKPMGAAYGNWMKQASQGCLAEVASKKGALELKDVWQKQPRNVKNDPSQQAAYVEQLIAQNMHQDAEQALVDYQKKGVQPLLLPLFKQLRLSQPVKAKKALESWLKKDEDNIPLLSTLGHLAFHSGDLDLAERAISKVVSVEHAHQDVLLLAQIKEAKQLNLEALALYKQSITN